MDQESLIRKAVCYLLLNLMTCCMKYWNQFTADLQTCSILTSRIRMISEKAITVSERVIDVGVDGTDIDVVNRWNDADGM